MDPFKHALLQFRRSANHTDPLSFLSILWQGTGRSFAFLPHTHPGPAHHLPTPPTPPWICACYCPNMICNALPRSHAAPPPAPPSSRAPSLRRSSTGRSSLPPALPRLQHTAHGRGANLCLRVESTLGPRPGLVAKLKIPKLSH